MDGSLYLIDAENGESVEAEIVFMYSTIQYTGYFCGGIVKIGDRIGTVYVYFTVNIRKVLFREDNTLVEEEAYNKKIKEIVEYLDDDCRYSEAIHVDELSGIEGMKRLVKQYHAMQRRNDNPEIPYTEHLYGVASVLKSVVESNKEIPENTLEWMIQAALGHDLLEDTVINEDAIMRIYYNNKVLEIIRELTNPNDDAHTDEYMERIASASEEARLIKYADLIENTSSFCYSLHELNLPNPIQRAKEYYLPVLSRTTDVLEKTLFELYPKTAETMQILLKVYTDLLLNRVKYIEGDKH